jgi:hypothetical protein
MVDFGATWCGPSCKQLESISRMLSLRNPIVLFLKVTAIIHQFLLLVLVVVVVVAVVAAVVVVVVVFVAAAIAAILVIYCRGLKGVRLYI